MWAVVLWTFHDGWNTGETLQEFYDNIEAEMYANELAETLDFDKNFVTVEEV